MSRKRAKRAAGEAEATEGQALLFEVPKPPAPEGGAVPKVVRCSECNTMLRSDRTKAAGVSDRCAAKVGVIVITSMRNAKSAGSRTA